MMFSTFTSFDPTLMPSKPPLYLLSILPLMIFQHTFWMNPPHRLTYPLFWVMNMTNFHMNKTKSHMAKGLKSILTPLFWLILLLNLLGMGPYLFPLTSHLMITLSWSGPMWLTLFMLALPSLKQFMAHTLPDNSPLILAPLLVMIETLSSIIRPITLAFRLATNISAGHLIMGLMAVAASFLGPQFLLAWPLMLFTIGQYVMFEFMVAFIQAFVFFILTNMYTNDYFTKC